MLLSNISSTIRPKCCLYDIEACFYFLVIDLAYYAPWWHLHDTLMATMRYLRHEVVGDIASS